MNFILSFVALDDLSRVDAHFIGRVLGHPSRNLALFGDVDLLLNPLTFECVLRFEPDLLKKFLWDKLSVTVGNGITILQYACILGSVDCLKFLFYFVAQLRALVGQPDWVPRWITLTDMPELLCFCDARFPFGNRLGVLRLLIEHGNLDAQVPAHQDALQSFLDVAAYFGSEWTIMEILTHFPNSLNLTASVRFAFENGRFSSAQLLLEQGAQANLLDRSGGAALIHAFNTMRLDCFGLLLKHGVVANSADGASLLSACLQKAHIGFARLLLDHGTDVNTKDPRGDTPLILVSQGGVLDLALLLLERGADYNAKNARGVTALIRASQNGRLDLARLLLERGADVDSKTQEGWTALTCAYGQADCAELLLEHGAAVDARDEDGWTALIRASQEGHVSGVRFLLEHGADVNATGFYG